MRVFSFSVGTLLILVKVMNAASLEFHQTRGQAPQKCDLVCPGVAPISLPSSLLQNCTSSTTNPTTTTSTTKRPSTRTTTESGEEENTEGNEGEEGRIVKRQKKAGRHKSTRQHSQHQKNHQRMKKHTLILKPEAKSKLFKNHKSLKEKSQLNGCYVLCNEEGGAPISSVPPAPGGTPPETGGDTGEDPGDNYVEGEDTPVEIIYVPPIDNSYKRPSEMYEINNYLVDPVPDFGFGYDPLFMEGKHKIIKKRKHHHLRKKTNR